VWTRGLARWYIAHGRHALPWRLSSDPWEVLMSEVMLQQTQVARVQPRWTEFVGRWPGPAQFAAAPLSEVLRAWDGLGYPRRAAALHRTAALVARGWPRDERGLRSLPGVGRYTARALLTIAFDAPGVPPRDVNIGRIVARAALGVEPHAASERDLDDALLEGRPGSLSWRQYTYALFDAGALHCRAVPRCRGCPLAGHCASRARLAEGPERPARARGASRYRGSTRELRGALLRAVLDGTPAADLAALRVRVAGRAAATSDRAVAAALAGLRRDGLIALTEGTPL
jgi:A/G-specific adenine glycosylase